MRLHLGLTAAILMTLSSLGYANTLRFQSQGEGLSDFVVIKIQDRHIEVVQDSNLLGGELFTGRFTYYFQKSDQKFVRELKAFSKSMKSKKPERPVLHNELLLTVDGQELSTQSPWGKKIYSFARKVVARKNKRNRSGFYIKPTMKRSPASEHQIIAEVQKYQNNKRINRVRGPFIDTRICEIESTTMLKRCHTKYGALYFQ